MDAGRFDALTRSFRVAAPRRAALGALAAGLAALLPHDRQNDAAAGKHKKRCHAGRKKCGKRCIPKANCCRDPDCGTNERCDHGRCEPCLPQGTVCTEDSQCCTGICDTYTSHCQQVRVSCENGAPCPNGRCCGDSGDPRCLYEKATQGPCEAGVSCGLVVCGDRCSHLTDGTAQSCGIEGSAACRKGRCCCPKGVRLEDCPKSGGGNLPRCK